MNGWRSAWRSLTQAIKCPACGELPNPSATCRRAQCGADISKVKSSTAGLCFDDLRHHAITELAESQASDRTIMSIAGHVSQQMLAHYSHVRIEARRKALDALAAGSKRLVTTQTTTQNHLKGAILSSQTIERNGGDDGTRTRGLCRDRAAF
jgi:Phage integrase family